MKIQERQTREDVMLRAIFWTLTALLIGILLALLLVPPAQAGEINSESWVQRVGFDDLPAAESFFSFQKLNDMQKIAYLAALALIDYRQTVLSVVAHPEQYHETNPVLGPHPSRDRLLVFGAIGIATTAFISRIDHPLTRVVVDSIIATEQINIYENQYFMDRGTSMPIMLAVSYQF